MTKKKPAPAIDRKERLKIPPIVIPKQDAKERIKNWDEVYLELDIEAARREASRCLQCPAAACTDACPLHNDIVGAFALLEKGDIIGAANKFRETSPMPEVCGRLCPHELLCEGHCVVGKKGKPGAIGRLEYFLADYQRKHEGWPLPKVAPPTGRKVAVVGSGPAGLVVAEELTKRGHSAVVYEAWPLPGGLLRYGIPSFIISKSVIDDKIRMLEKLGVTFVTNTVIGRDITVDQLLDGEFDAVFLGYGAGQGVKMGVPGEDLEGIIGATDFLVRANVPSEHLPPHWRKPIDPGDKVAVIGGGNTAMDCLRAALRLGAREVTCIYRRTEAEMPGNAKERENSIEEGAKFMYLAAPIEFIGDEHGRLRIARCQRMQLGEPDASGRPRPVPIPDSEFDVPVDTVVLALGYRVEPLILETTPGLEANRNGTLIIDPETGATSRPGVFSGGDAVRGPDYVVDAVADAKRAAAAIDEYIRRKMTGET
ncbi:MAG: NAD(P)-dependent oxidoreductase [Dehalococcoidia bacterium]